MSKSSSAVRPSVRPGVKIGADAYAADALIAVDKARACISTLADLKGGDPALHAKMLAIDAEREAQKAKATAAAA